MKGILLSGGLDSLALAYWQKPQIAFTVDYGQKAAEAEIRASAKITKDLGIRHVIITIDVTQVGSGDLLNTTSCQTAPKSDWWPFRNQMLLTTVCSYIMSHDIAVKELLFATVANDSYHKDGTKNFFSAFNDLLACQEGDIQILTPAINMSAVELIRTSKVTLEKLSWGHSCHKSNYACGECRGCYKHQNTLDELGWSLTETIK
ncbi:7-cyano-7-deazaguanine synthase [Sulfurovum sp.]|uniref:7-cyano-7-deazaguanine synthase n=1 Tax=Sulfurovum sp. TaxID=1969726 RepID=UPI0035659A74